MMITILLLTWCIYSLIKILLNKTFITAYVNGIKELKKITIVTLYYRRGITYVFVAFSHILKSYRGFYALWGISSVCPQAPNVSYVPAV